MLNDVSLNLHVYLSFPVLFLISSFIVEQTLCDFNSFKLVELHFMAQKVNIYWWMSHVSLRIMFNILLLDEVACSCQLCPVDQWCFEFSCALTDFLPAGSVHF